MEVFKAMEARRRATIGLEILEGGGPEAKIADKRERVLLDNCEFLEQE